VTRSYELFNAEVADRFEREQLDLDSLCADRELVTTQQFAPNDWYGMATVMAAYAGLPAGYSSRALIPHGVYFNDTRVSVYESRAKLPVVLAYEEYRLSLYAHHGVLALPSAAPFCYANRIVRYQGDRRGVLFFPAHSTHWMVVETDWQALADMAAALCTSEEPVSVVIYWKDYLLGRHRPFLERGLKVVSAGHMYDPDFLLRLAYLLQSSRAAYTSALGSHVYYATHAGCPIRIMSQPYGVEARPEDLARDVVRFTPARMRAWHDIEDAFSTQDDGILPEQARIAEYYLSADAILDPGSLKSLLEWIERLDKFGWLGARHVMPREASARRGHPGIVPFAFKRAVDLRPVEMAVRRIVERIIAGLRDRFPALRDVRIRK
jgi:hypothetical protein